MRGPVFFFCHCRALVSPGDIFFFPLVSEPEDGEGERRVITAAAAATASADGGGNGIDAGCNVEGGSASSVSSSREFLLVAIFKEGSVEMPINTRGVGGTTALALPSTPPATSFACSGNDVLTGLCAKWPLLLAILNSNYENKFKSTVTTTAISSNRTLAKLSGSTTAVHQCYASDQWSVLLTSSSVVQGCQ